MRRSISRLESVQFVDELQRPLGGARRKPSAEMGSSWERNRRRRSTSRQKESTETMRVFQLAESHKDGQ